MFHCAPEVLNSLGAFLDATCMSAEVDYTRQGSFEAGVLLCEVIFGCHPLGEDYPAPYYPEVWDRPDFCCAIRIHFSGYRGWYTPPPDPHLLKGVADEALRRFRAAQEYPWTSL